MQRVGIRELKANLSRCLRAVQGGAEIEILSRGRVVARVIGVEQPSSWTVDDVLDDLASQGLAVLPDVKAKPKRAPRLSPGRGTAASQIVRNHRR